MECKCVYSCAKRRVVSFYIQKRFLKKEGKKLNFGYQYNTYNIREYLKKNSFYQIYGSLRFRTSCVYFFKCIFFISFIGRYSPV